MALGMASASCPLARVWAQLDRCHRSHWLPCVVTWSFVFSLAFGALTLLAIGKPPLPLKLLGLAQIVGMDDARR